MTGRTLNWYWKAMWAFVSPLLIIGLFVFYLSDYILTGTLQYQAWDATQVPHVPAGLGSRAEPAVSPQNTGLHFSAPRNPCCGLGRSQVVAWERVSQMLNLVEHHRL